MVSLPSCNNTLSFFGHIVGWYNVSLVKVFQVFKVK